MASFGGETTSGNAAVSMGTAADHAACDATTARLRHRAEAAEAELVGALAVQDRLRGHLDAIAARLPAILEALHLADGVHEGDGQYKAARETLDGVWPF